VTAEPRVEELLANIRRAIDRDINELDAKEQRQAPAPKLRGTLQQDAPIFARRVERNADNDLASLRQRVHRQKIDTTEELPSATRRQPLFYQPVAEPEPQAQLYQPEPVPYYPPHETPWQEAPLEPTYVEEPQASDALLSPQATYAAQASFQALTNAVMSQLGGDVGLQEKARELLKPMLKSWLDDHLPSLVERMVRDEIERVARRGR